MSLSFLPGLHGFRRTSRGVVSTDYRLSAGERRGSVAAGQGRTAAGRGSTAAQAGPTPLCNVSACGRGGCEPRGGHPPRGHDSGYSATASFSITTLTWLEMSLWSRTGAVGGGGVLGGWWGWVLRR